MLNLFEYSSYKAILKDVLTQKRKLVGPSFTSERMAKACGVQKTYLSRVLNSDKAHLSEEQLYLAARFVGLNKDERDFVQLLRTFERSHVEEFRHELALEIERVRRRHRKTDAYLSVSSQIQDQPSDWSAYYLNPNIMLTHIFLTVDEYRRDMEQICSALRMTRVELDDVLRALERLELIRWNENAFVVTNKRTHLSSDSSLYKSFRTLQRIKALEQLARLSTDEAYSFSVAFSSDPQTRKALHQKILQFIKETEKMVDSGKEKRVYQLNIDLFDWR